MDDDEKRLEKEVKFWVENRQLDEGGADEMRAVFHGLRIAGIDPLIDSGVGRDNGDYSYLYEAAWRILHAIRESER